MRNNRIGTNKLLPTIFAAALWLSCAGMANAQAPYFQGAMVPSPAPFTGFALLSKSGTASSHTGDTNETALATITIPANTLAANGQIKINAFWTVTNNADSKNIRIRLGGSGVSGTQIFVLAATTVANVWSSSFILDLNATNSQAIFSEASRGTDGLVTTQETTSAVDMTASQILVISGQLATGTDTITLNGYSVEVAN
jgi:hypothetical protein